MPLIDLIINDKLLFDFHLSKSIRINFDQDVDLEEKVIIDS